MYIPSTKTRLLAAVLASLKHIYTAKSTSNLEMNQRSMTEDQV